MSTKIYNGMKFLSRDWKEVLDQLSSIKSKAIEIGNDSVRVGDIELFITSNKLLDKKEWDIFNSIQRSNHLDCFAIQINFSVILYPTKEGDIYGYYFNSIPKYENLLKPFYTEFCYYDNTDQPDYLTEDEWYDRGEKWDELVPNRYIDSGFQFTIVSQDDLDRQSIQEKITKVLAYVKRDNKIEKIISEDK